MHRTVIKRVALILGLAAALGSCANIGGIGPTASLYEQLGGSTAVTNWLAISCGMQPAKAASHRFSAKPI
jgi:hypothetical protein